MNYILNIIHKNFKTQFQFIQPIKTFICILQIEMVLHNEYSRQTVEIYKKETALLINDFFNYTT